MSDRPKVTINDRVHGTRVWVEPHGYDMAVQDIKAQGVVCREGPPEPAFSVITVTTEEGKHLDKNNIKSTLEGSEDLEFISFAEALRMNDEARRQKERNRTGQQPPA